MKLDYQPQTRDRLYYDQYHYGLSFYLAHSGRSRKLDADSIRESALYTNTFGWRTEKIDDRQINNLVDCAQIFLDCAEPYKRIVYSNWQYVYTNHEPLLHELATRSYLTHIKPTQAVVTLPRDVVLLKNSKYQYRSYFASRWFNRDEVLAIKNFLKSRKSQFKTTPNVTTRLNGDFFYPGSHLFVDHNDEKDAFLLNMVVSKCIRKTLPIQIAK